ncbi:MAG: hypothetical protein LUI06_09970 [Ruminococcus sp.]|nr:hypothetical protein [Ruminococcus sp.]
MDKMTNVILDGSNEDASKRLDEMVKRIDEPIEELAAYLGLSEDDDYKSLAALLEQGKAEHNEKLSLIRKVGYHG